jgi:hypothetical protein
LNIVLPIVLMAVAVGLFVPKHLERHAYWGMGAWIVLVVAYYYLKN